MVLTVKNSPGSRITGTKGAADSAAFNAEMREGAVHRLQNYQVKSGDNCGRGAAAIRGGNVETILDAWRWFDADQEPGSFRIDDGLSLH